ncbi:3-deoxy-manno-octulosonate-8-phosphatase KdsC [Candidatus Ruthia endofausta]|uniref:3-deoxy-D-manno-octulosonate 8-phosphate phosphatase KdsC n=1 Tax=Candidatus Ruthia endofausta TaxID=2738852 RepID=A0A6N0HQE3_9GAMM|nr:3-deoxy-manno-octulosonate-8-phosphatase KdsC [Candidatus Ruthia endofausta]QKQ24546.1 3-deoxy-manno-octulosonate-8-phosphatase KdsC [Candidatus Ruthia endofausta]
MQLLDKFYLQAEHIKLIIFDVDGVLTDGGLYFSDEGIELKRFNSFDGLGIKLLKQNGIEVAVISARNSKNVAHRMKNLGIEHFYQGQDDKVVAFNNLIKKLSLQTEQVAYMGDDIIDLPVMRKVNLPIAVANAHELVKENACFVTEKIGGYGAVREVCDLLLKAQNTFNKAMEKYLT